MIPLLRSLVFFCLIFGQVVPALAAEPLPEVLAKARRLIGSEADLHGVETLRFLGKVVTESGFEAELEIVFKKPSSSWLRLETAESVEITANNAHEGYLLSENKTTGRRNLQVLPGPAVSRLANGAWERLNFFAHPRSRFGNIKLEGKVRYDDRMSEKVVFYYPGEIWSARYFDSDTGRLLMTVNDSGLVYMEDGFKRAGGITFPARVHVRDGKNETKVMHFDLIEVNGPVDDSLFHFPLGK